MYYPLNTYLLRLKMEVTLTLTFQCHSTSNVIGLIIMTTYYCLMVTYGLTRLVLQDITLQNLSDWLLTFQRSLKVKCDGGIGLLIYDYPLLFNGNIWPNSSSFTRYKIHSLSDLDFDLSRSLKVKCGGATGLPYMVNLVNMVNWTSHMWFPINVYW